MQTSKGLSYMSLQERREGLEAFQKKGEKDDDDEEEMEGKNRDEEDNQESPACLSRCQWSMGPAVPRTYEDQI